MGVALIIIAVVIATAVINDKLGELGSLVKSDLFGSGSDKGFIIWIAAILILGSFLRVLDMPEAGRALVILIVLAFLLGHADIPNQILSAVEGAGSGGREGGPNASPSK